MLAIAHAFETFGRMAPCELCLKERTVWWAALFIGMAGGLLTHRFARARTIACLALGAVLLGGALLAGYHAGVEWRLWPGPQSCSGGSGAHVTAADMLRFMRGDSKHMVRCDQPAWLFLGLSMAGWNALISLAAAVASALAARRGASR